MLKTNSTIYPDDSLNISEIFQSFILFNHFLYKMLISDYKEDMVKTLTWTDHMINILPDAEKSSVWRAEELWVVPDGDGRQELQVWTERHEQEPWHYQA